MKNRIQPALQNIENEEDVKIIYACESGSRAWGFASMDSDYDVRFIYLHSLDWYLSINLEQKRDVIERPIDEGIDLSGWDLRKALGLFRKSNPPLLEWLGSPIVYLERYTVAEKMRALIPFCYSPIACMYHYYSMARGNYRDYLQGEQVWVKKYLYVLRPILAVLWLERGKGVVPTQFQELVAGLIQPGPLNDAIQDLLDKKSIGMELDRGLKDPVISEFLEKEIDRLESQEFEIRIDLCSVDELNRLFRWALEEAWQISP